ncbi:endonuclease/exonuclease/phosphatase family protein [Flavivirga aquimarina]|uniref:Endonuclease/exonuclease/phosphatase family protein n=1 Tax=Flavivirga aquimarina TaxID=2027862 RepID=A0ABT8WAZ8_9FLAO|nr:endonuclease/exonuclease/phosphatase family protein [Flavivirga aquimarina]MDO5970295.1 endonuclease/exonuclease/phosphatase family protein [Flavivirga aquimarina]
MAFYHHLKNYKNDSDYPNKQEWISSRLLTLRHDLYETIEKDREPKSLIIGSWNIRAFDGGMPRLDESYHYIAEIIDHFDICAIQEIKSSLKPLRRLVKLLGPNWDFFVSDVSTHKGGNSERMAFVYNTNRVFFRNLIGEIVLPKENLIDGEQVARSPFFASFQAGWFRFSLCSAHIVFGNDLSKRAAEIKAVADVLVKRAKSEDQVHIFLGDMNIEEKDDVVMQALKESKLTVPEFGFTNMGGDRWFDQIAFTEKGKAGRKTRLLRHGKFDWRHAVFGPHPNPQEKAPKLTEADNKKGKKRLTKDEILNHYEKIVEQVRKKHDKKPYKDWAKSYSTWTTHEMSDHLPIWMELEIDYSDDYLRRYL